MQKNFLLKQRELQKQTSEHKKTPREILVSRLGYRGLEVLTNAEAQFPAETKIVVDKLAELITSGEINEIIDGGKLLMLFRSIGLNVRMKTRINIAEDGKIISLSEKLSSKADKTGEE